VLQLDVWSDIACPWCYLGKRRLEAAIKASGTEVEVTWHAFELAPELPREGVLVEEWLGKRYPKDKVDEMHAHLAELGKADGIDFQFDRRTRMANTRLAHRAIRISHALGGTALQGKVVEACFRANFTDGVDVGDRNALLAALADTGVELEDLRLRLMDTDATAEVVADEKLAKEIGIDGVPFFIAEGKLAMSGAQAPEVFTSFLAEAATLAAAATTDR
jgi:predicted DsbA family dithiol-disulfide isomerase